MLWFPREGLPQYVVDVSPWEILSFMAGKWSATFQGVVRRWIDGDTVDVDISFTWVTIHARLRLARVDAAEIVTQDGLKALAEMQKAFPPGSTVTVHVYDRDRYQRLLGDILLNGRSASEYLKSAGLG
jgi:endonuclease YncB( thermonuclease family)